MEENDDNEIVKRWTRSLHIERRVSELAEKLATKLNKDIAAGHDIGAFSIAIGVASFKDFLDVILTASGIGVVPGVAFLLSLFTTTFLLVFMWGKGFMLKWKFRIMYAFVGIFVEGLPLMSALPMNAILVLYAWRTVKKRGSRAEENLEKLDIESTEVIQQIHEDMQYEMDDVAAQYLRPSYKPRNRDTRDDN